MSKINVMLGNQKIKVNNKREESLVRIISQSLETQARYLRENTFGENTHAVIEKDSIRVDGLLTALYFMEIAPNLDESNILDVDSPLYQSLYWYITIEEQKEEK